MNAVSYKFSDNTNKKLDGAEIYLDHANSRLKILSYEELSREFLAKVLAYAKEEGLGKVLCNCRIKDLKYFKEVGFAIEGLINGFFKGEDAYCVSFFLDRSRAYSARKEEEDRILKMCFEKGKMTVPSKLNSEYKMKNCVENDIPQMVKLFKAVFKTYPSPVFDHDYLKEVMNTKILFKAVYKGDNIISIASGDMDKDNLNAEITDCATYPEYRGQGLLSNLVYALEADLVDMGFYTLYSLSRAINTGINMSLRKQGYNYSGRLVNNCNICGGFEDMNIWIKRLYK